MHFWTWLSVLLGIMILSLAQNAQEEEYNSQDSLISALDAVSRRQRDLADADSNSETAFYGLGSYREPAENDGDIAFLSPDRDMSDDGQPENIGYGFQKTISNNPSGIFEDFPPTSNQLLEKLAIQYLEDELEKDEVPNDYYRVGDDMAKRSVFRERELPERYSNVGSRLILEEQIRKRGEAMEVNSAFLPSPFRERTHHKSQESVDDKRRRFAATINHRIAQEQASANEDYPQLIQSLWERYRDRNPNVVDIESLSQQDVEEILDFLGDKAAKEKDLEEGKEKRYNSGSGYNFFNHGAVMNGGSFGFKKRNKQKLDHGDNPENAFLYSLKFVAPEYNREAVEQMREQDGLDLSGETDEDVVRLGLKVMAQDEPEIWFPAMAVQEEDEIPRNLHEHALKPPGSKYQMMPQELFVPNHRVDKKYLYDRALLKRKRFMVSKRSPNFYSNPTALHHHEVREIRKKKEAHDVHATNPKVASELSQIFSPTSATSENSIKIVPQIIGNHVVTKQKSIPPPTPTAAPAPKMNATNIEVTVVVNQYIKKNITAIEDRPDPANDEEIELPVTMSRLEIPIEVEKKSVDWSDYFGLDRRRKKTGQQVYRDNSNRAIDGDLLLNQYYKKIVNANNPAYKKNNMNAMVQPFDTRIYDADNLQRTHQSVAEKKNQGPELDPSRIDAMDSKLRNIEDLIVNEAVKYTGAHEGTTDSKEIQDVKDKVMSRLAAAYNLEKMRRALGEFKSSLAAQKASKYNPENRGLDQLDADKMKRVAIKKERADVGNDEIEDEQYEKPDEVKKMKRKNSDEKFAEFLEGPMVQSMSEGRMGGIAKNRHHLGLKGSEGDCPVLGNIIRNCGNMGNRAGDEDQQFLPLCTLHQICSICGPEVGSQSQATCDGMFLNKADEMCNGDVFCEKAALHLIMGVKRHQSDDDAGVTSECWEGFCLAQMNPPPGNQS